MHTQHGAVDEVALEDLSLYIQTTSQLYPRRQALQENIARRVENGTYDPGTAWKLALPLVNDGAHAYAREFRGRGNVFSRATREALAQRMAHDEYTEIVLQRQLGRDEAAYAGHLRDLERRPDMDLENDHPRWGRPGGGREVSEESPTGNFRVDAFLDGDHFAVVVKKGQAPARAVAHSLNRRLDADVQLWPSGERSPNGEMYTAKWYDPKTQTYREGKVEIWNAARRPEAGEPRPWPRRSSAAREDGPGGSLRWIQTGDVYEAKAPLGGGKYVINVDPNNADGFQTWYLPVSKDDEAPMLGASTTLGGAMNLAKDHANAMAGVRRAAEEGPGPFRHEDDRDLEILLDVERPFGERKLPPPQTSVVYDRHYKILSNHGYIKWVRVNENEQSFQDHYELTDKGREALDDYRRYVKRLARGTANERVPVIHEGADVVAASVTTTETATVVTAKEDFKTAAMAEQHAYTEGFRYIAERGRKYDIYKRRQVGKKGYEKRELYHRRGKWHISGDKRFVSRLGRDARKILVDQGAKTIPIEHAAEGPKFERCVKSVKKRGEAVNPYAVCTTSVGQGREGRKLTLAQAKAELRPLGLTLTSLDGEYRVNFRRGNEESAYYTPDLEDAVATGKDMAKRGADGADDKDFARIGPRDRVTIVDRFGVERTGRAVMRGPHGWVLNMGGKHGTPAIASPENIVRVRKSKEAYEMAAESPRKNKVIGYVGDVNWIEYGGGPIYRTEHGEVLEYLDVSDEEDGKTLVYRVDLDPEVPSWGSIEDAARTSGQDVEELRKAFTSKDPFDRAYAYQTWAGHYGWHEFDSYPLELSKAEVNKRYFGTLQALKKLPRPHGYKWSASESRRKRGAREGGEPRPKPGEYWHRADGSHDGVTIIEIDDDPTDPWVTYQYANGQQHEKNLLAFRARFYKKEGGAPGSGASEATRRREKLVVKLDSEADARKLRDDLDRTTKGYNDRMGSNVWTSAPRSSVVEALDRLGIVGTIESDVSGGAEECAPCAAHEACEKHPKKRKDVDDTAEAASEATNGACVAIVERVPGCVPTGIKMETPRDVYDFMAPRYAKLGGEHFFVLLISNQGELLGAPIEIARGQPDRVAVDIEQIVAAAITGAAAGARGWVVSHGHPSGGEFARPSQSDKRLTQDIRDAAKVACPSTAFIDHVIVAAPTTGGVGSYYSFEEKKVTKVSAPN